MASFIIKFRFLKDKVAKYFKLSLNLIFFKDFVKKFKHYIINFIIITIKLNFISNSFMFITIFMDSIINIIMISEIIIIAMDRAIKIVVTIISSLLDYSLSMMVKFKVVTHFIKEINYFEVNFDYQF